MMPALGWAEKHELAVRAASIIDTQWHFSWHWDRSIGGTLTQKGWEQAYADCCERIAQVKQELDNLCNLRDELAKAPE